MIDKHFFKKHQKALLWVINTRIGRWLFGVEKMGQRAEGQKIIEVFPNGIKTIVGYEGIKVKYRYQFFNKPEYAIRVGKVLFWMPIAEFYRGLVLRPAYQLAFILILGIVGFHFPIFIGNIITPNSNDGGDKALAYYDGATWATSHDATSANFSYDNSYVGERIEAANHYTIRRYFLPFDTSAIADTDIVYEAIMKVYVTSVTSGDQDGEDYVAVVQSSQASATSIANSDYNDLGTTELSNQISVPTATTSAYNNFVLTEAGRAIVSLTSYTKLGLREGHDILNHPTVNQTGTDIFYSIYDASNASNKPVFSVETFQPTTLQVNYRPRKRTAGSVSA